MTSRQERELPKELVGIMVDAPNAALAAKRAEQFAAAPAVTAAAGTGTFRVHCYVRSTKTDLGYFGISTNNWVDFVGQDQAAICEWFLKDGKLYLQVNNATVLRYLGEGDWDYACWGLWTPTGKVNPVQVRDDSIYLSGTNQTLYPYGNGWMCWGNTDTNIICKFEPAK